MGNLLGNHVMSKIYLSGPISLDGKATQEQIDGYIRRFSYHCANFRNAGFYVINPCELTHQDSWEDYMKLNIPSVCECNVVAVLPDWELSRGSRLEVFLAHELGIPVMKVNELYPNAQRDNV